MSFRSDLVECLRKLDFNLSNYNRWYLETYNPFVGFFRERITVPDLQLSDAIVGVALVYSWMPTMPRQECGRNFLAAREALLLCTKHNPEDEQIEAIRLFVGGSMVAASKFLHFCAPHRYPIWDRRVVRGGYDRAWRANVDNSTERYLEYLRDLKALDLPKMIKARVSQIAHDSSDLRIKEFALFSLGAWESKAGHSRLGAK
jgi:hypothetical protein